METIAYRHCIWNILWPIQDRFLFFIFSRISMHILCFIKVSFAISTKGIALCFIFRTILFWYWAYSTSWYGLGLITTRGWIFIGCTLRFLFWFIRYSMLYSESFNTKLLFFVIQLSSTLFPILGMVWVTYRQTDLLHARKAFYRRLAIRLAL